MMSYLWSNFLGHSVLALDCKLVKHRLSLTWNAVLLLTLDILCGWSLLQNTPLLISGAGSANDIHGFVNLGLLVS